MRHLVRVIARRILRDFTSHPKHRDAKKPLETWYSEARAATWETPHDIKARYGHASFLGDSRVVFNIAGNKYRLIAKVNYGLGIVYIRFLGTHQAYDQIDPESV